MLRHGQGRPKGLASFPPIEGACFIRAASCEQRGVVSLADRLSTIAPTTKCIVCLWYRTLAKDDRAAFDKVADHVPDVYSFAEFHRICALEGLECSESSFKRHMKIHREPR